MANKHPTRDPVEIGKNTRFTPGPGGTAAVASKKGNESQRRQREEDANLEHACKVILQTVYSHDKDGNPLTGAQAMAMKLFRQFMETGKAADFVAFRDTAGQKPVEKVMIAEVDEAAISEVEAMMDEE